MEYIDGYAAYTSYNAPQVMALWQKDGKKYLKFYPTPEADEDITLFGSLRIVPKLYENDELTVDIHLSSEYEEIIKAFVKAEMYSWLKDRKSAQEERQRCLGLLKNFQSQIPSHSRRSVTYS